MVGVKESSEGGGGGNTGRGMEGWRKEKAYALVDGGG